MKHCFNDFQPVYFLKLALLLLAINVPMLAEATCVDTVGGVALYEHKSDQNDSTYFSYAQLCKTRANNADGTGEIMGKQPGVDDITIFNNWPSDEDESGDDDMGTHYLYSPEDFHFDNNALNALDNDKPLGPPIFSVLDDGKPLDNRTPIILVHGWQGANDTATPESQRANELSAEEYWGNFIRFFTEHHSLKELFKIYVYKYPSYKHVTFNAKIFRNMLVFNAGINELREHFNANKRAIFVAHSMGTIVVRSAFEEHLLPVNYAKKIILLDGVHHGSPGAIPFWVEANTFPKDLYTLGANDIQWDNYDAIFMSTTCLDNESGCTKRLSHQVFEDIALRSNKDYDNHYTPVGDIEIKNLKKSEVLQRNFYKKIRLQEVVGFDYFYKNQISELLQNLINTSLPIFKFSNEVNDFLSRTYKVSYSGYVIYEQEMILPLVPNPWLLYLNLKHQTMSDEYKRSIILYASIHVNGEIDISALERNKNNHIKPDDTGFGLAEDGVQHLGELFDMNPWADGHYGYLNDGPVPINGQLMDMKCSFDNLVSQSGEPNSGGSAQVTMYFRWKQDGYNDGTATIKSFPVVSSNKDKDCLEILSSNSYQGNGYAKHILFMDYHHDRMLNGAYKTSDLGFGSMTGFVKQDDRKSYIKNALSGQWEPEDSDLFGDVEICQEGTFPSFHDTCTTRMKQKNSLRLEPLFLSIAYQLEPKHIIDSLENSSQITFVDFPPENRLLKGHSYDIKWEIVGNSGNSNNEVTIEFAKLSSDGVSPFDALQPASLSDIQSISTGTENDVYSWPIPDNLEFGSYSIKIQSLSDSSLYAVSSSFLIASSCEFSDVNEDSYYTKSIKKLCALGVVDGYDDGTFGVGSKVSRAEFLKMALLTYELTEKQSMSITALEKIKSTRYKPTAEVEAVFSDVKEEHWASGYIYHAYADDKKVVKGYSDGQFYPNEIKEEERSEDDLSDGLIARVGAAKILAKLFVPDTVDPIGKKCPEYNDMQEGEWYCKFLTALKDTNIMKGYADGTFGVADKMSREDVAVAACRAYAYKRDDIPNDFCDVQ